MKISLQWLNTYLDRAASADEAEAVLTDIGFPIDDREDLADGDVLLDVEVTSNRPDLLSHTGLARELAAALDRQVIRPDSSPPADSSPPVDTLTGVDNEATDLCPLYSARVIRGTKVAKSPDWLIKRLESVGLRSINNVVDVTNFVLMELGQPLHAFDMNKLAERRIVVRRAVEGEQFVAIDSSKHRLNTSMLVIADARRPVAIAGVMGGIDTEVSAQTTDVLLESAQFDPLSVRQTSRGLKLFTDSSFRFERGVDFYGVENASRRAAKLIVELAGGQIACGVVQTGVDAPPQRAVEMRPARCTQIIGQEVPVERMIECLNRLGLQAQLIDQGAMIRCVIPSHRLDLHREIDLIEEVARLNGYERIEFQDRIHIVARHVQPAIEGRQRLVQVLGAHGYYEIVTFNTVAEMYGQPFLPDGADSVTICGDRRRADPMLRPSLWPSLLACRKRNQDLGNKNVRLYEMAAVWWRRNDTIVEQEHLGMLCDAQSSQVDLRALRGMIEECIERVSGAVPLAFEPIEHGHLTVAAEILAGGTLAAGDGKRSRIGVIGQLAGKWLDAFELKMPVSLVQLELEPILGLYPPTRQVAVLGRFPGIERDLSVVVAEDVTWQQIEQDVRRAQPELMENLTFVQTYRGKPIPAGQKSVTFRMLFRDLHCTLRHEQVDPQVAAIAKRLAGSLGAELRA